MTQNKNRILILLSMPRTRPVLKSISRPKQARSHKTLQKLLDAAQSLIEERGCMDLSIPEVVARAGSSVGGFYSRFRDKDELLCALEERFLQHNRRMLDRLTSSDALADAKLEDIARPAIKQLVNMHRTHHRLAAAFVAQTARDPSHRNRVAKFREEIVERFGSLLLSRRDEINHPQPERAVDFIIKMVLSGARQEAVFGVTVADGQPLSEHDMAAELERMFLTYLGMSAPTEE